MSLYWNQSEVVRVDKEKIEEIEFLRGVRQGCIPVSYTHLDVYKRQL